MRLSLSLSVISLFLSPVPSCFGEYDRVSEQTAVPLKSHTHVLFYLTFLCQDTTELKLERHRVVSMQMLQYMNMQCQRMPIAVARSDDIMH